jgi:hypothetical protein
MSNDHIKSEISPYLAGGLTESRNRQIEAHAAACEKCRNAMAKARAKQARGKREALKKASTDPLPNLFLARQGKAAGVDNAPAKAPWMLVGMILLAGAGYYAIRHSSFFSHPLTVPMPESDSAAVETSSAPAPSVETPSAPPPPVKIAPPVVHAETPNPPAIIAIQQEWKGAESGIQESRVVVIRNRGAWDKLWTDMQSKDPLPEINFDDHVVIGVFSSERPIGSSIVFGKIRESDNEVIAPYRVVIPDTQVSSTTAPAPTHPYLLSLIPRVDKKIRLTEREASQ